MLTINNKQFNSSNTESMSVSRSPYRLPVAWRRLFSSFAELEGDYRFLLEWAGLYNLYAVAHKEG